MHSGAVPPEDRQTCDSNCWMTVNRHGDLQKSSSRSCTGGTTARAQQSRLRLLLPGVWRPPHPTRRSPACHCPFRQRSPMVAPGQCITTMQQLVAAQSWQWRPKTGTGCNEGLFLEVAAVLMLGCMVPSPWRGSSASRTQQKRRGRAAMHAVPCGKQKMASRAVQRQGLLTSRGPAADSSTANLHTRAAQQLQPQAVSLVNLPRCRPGCCGVAPQVGRCHKGQPSEQPSTQPLRRVCSSQSQLWLQRKLQPRAALALVSARPRRHALQRGRRASGCAAC